MLAVLTQRMLGRSHSTRSPFQFSSWCSSPACERFAWRRGGSGFLCDSYITERSWQDLDFSRNATLGLFLATILSRKRLAFTGRLSRRELQLLCLRSLLASLESRRRRSCRTMPRNASQTLCCMAADVSTNLQSNTAAHARPSETERTHVNLINSAKPHFTAHSARHTETAGTVSPHH